MLNHDLHDSLLIYAQVEVLTNKLCIPRTRPPTSTLALIPFYSGLTRDGARNRGIDEETPNTGTAHSVSSGATKLKTLKAVLCSALSFCKAALVGVCTPGDYESVNELIGTLPAGQARAVLLNCEKSPAYVPFKLLRMVQRHAKGNLNASQVAPAARGVVPWLAELDFDYVLYDEADQTAEHGVARRLRCCDNTPIAAAPREGEAASRALSCRGARGRRKGRAELPRLAYRGDKI